MKTGLLLLFLAVVATVGHAQDSSLTWSNDEVLDRLIATRPKGKRTLAAPKLFETLEDKSWEQSVQPSDSGMSASRDFYGKDATGEFALRQVFVPIKEWKLKTPKQMLDEAKSQITGGTQATLLAETDYTLDGCPCRTFVARQAGTGRVVRLDYLLIYPDLYIVSWSGSEAGLKSPKITKFFSELKTEPVK